MDLYKYDTYILATCDANHELYSKINGARGNKLYLPLNFDTSYLIEVKIGTDIPIETDQTELSKLKAATIATLKHNLEDFLLTHPMTSNCHGGKSEKYNITLAKQELFATNYIAYKTLKEIDPSQTMYWNATGEEYEPWEDEECIQFIKETKAYVLPYVTMQQRIESHINKCLNKDQVKNVDLSFTTERVTKFKEDPNSLITKDEKPEKADNI